MSSVRVQKIFEAMPNQLRRLGKHDVDFREALTWQGRAGAGNWEGKDAAVIEMGGSKKVILIAEPAGDDQPDSMKTQSHAQGFFLDGSVKFHAFLEDSDAATDAELALWRAQVTQHLAGQLGAPVKLHLSANGTAPQVQGVAGAGSDAATTELDWLLPYGMTYPGGV